MTQEKKYILQFKDGTYYSENKRWSGVPKNEATLLTYADSYFIKKSLKKQDIGIEARIEEA